MAESIMLDKAKDFAVEIINMCKSILDISLWLPYLKNKITNTKHELEFFNQQKN